MSNLTIVRRGIAHADSSVGGGISPLDVAITAVKPGSAFLANTSIKQRRKDVFIQNGTINITNSDAGPTKDSAALGTAVDMASAYVIPSIREKRTDGYQGVSLKLQSTTVVRATFHQPAAGDSIDADFTVVEAKSYKGATLRLLDATHVRLEWDGTLVAGESIDAQFDVCDLDDIGDQLLETDFKGLRLLAFFGENSIEDGLTYDNAGNPITVRLRTFDNNADAAAAVKDVPDGDPMATGELSRVKSTLSWDTGRNRPSLIRTVLLAVAATPGIS